MSNRSPSHRRARLVVVGASLAGIRAIESARLNGWQGAITLIGAEDELPYDRPPLSKSFLDPEHGGRIQPFRSANELQSELGVELALGRSATALDTRSRTVTFGTDDVGYDSLVIATGSRAETLPEAEDLEGVHVLRTAADARRLRSALETNRRVVIVGAGLVGSEVASAARRRGLSTTIVEAEAAPLTRSLGPEAGWLSSVLHETAGTALRLGVSADSVESTDGHVTGVRLETGEVLPADMVVVGVGARPATAWLHGSDVELDSRDGGVLCDASLATSAADVWAAGDVAHFPNALFDHQLLRLEHWTNAAEQGTLAGQNIAAQKPRHLSTVPYFWSDWYGHHLQFVGVPTADEVVTVGSGGPGAIALYRRDDRAVGVFTIDHPADLMKLRRRIVAQVPWREVVETAEAVSESVARSVPIG